MHNAMNTPGRAPNQFLLPAEGAQSQQSEWLNHASVQNTMPHHGSVEGDPIAQQRIMLRQEKWQQGVDQNQQQQGMGLGDHTGEFGNKWLNMHQNQSQFS